VPTVRAVILSVAFAVAFGPAVQAAGLGVHGACHQGSHAQHEAPATAQPAGASAHAGHEGHHAASTAVEKADTNAATPSTDGKCKCGCLCPPGHACSTTSAGIASSVSTLAVVPFHFAPQSDASSFTVAEPSPHTRPPIETLR
jgi:hypothetical protein